ncbi:50S ribosomal protein L18 [Campylobacterota bacterium]|nr:50S ribosomal protein L18 [Campylobacterota bacterium]
MTRNVQKRKIATRLRRKSAIRAKLSGVAAKPRVTIFRSNRYIYAQAIDDKNGVTLAAFDGKKSNVRSNKAGAVEAAKAFAKALKAKKIGEVTFDRNGYLYHGVVAAFADALRDNAIKL